MQGENAQWVHCSMQLASKADPENQHRVSQCRTVAESPGADSGAPNDELERKPPPRGSQPNEPQKEGTSNDRTPADSLKGGL